MKSTSVTFLLLLAALAACNGDNKGKNGDGGDIDTDVPTEPSELPMVWINEVMAQNTSTWQDEGGNFADWLELWNPNDEAVDLSGWWMSTDVENPFDWQIPDGITIGPGAYLVVFCDKEPLEGDLHATFKLSSLGGEDVALFGPNVLDNPVVDVIEDMTIQIPDVSLARMPDGGPTWSQDDSATPAASNN